MSAHSRMRNRYELLTRLDVRIRPTYLDWVEILVYARSDFFESDDGMPGMKVKMDPFGRSRPES